MFKMQNLNVVYFVDAEKEKAELISKGFIEVVEKPIAPVKKASTKA